MQAKLYHNEYIPYLNAEVLHCESSSVCKSSLVIGCLCHHGHICIILIFHWQIRTAMLLQVVVQHSCSNDHFAASSWLETKRIS